MSLDDGTSSGTMFIIGEDTEIDGILQNGAEVEVEVTMDADGSRYATEIEVVEKDGRASDTQEDHEHPECSGSAGSSSDQEGSGEFTGQADEPRYEGTFISLSDGALMLLVDITEITLITNDNTEFDGILEPDVEVRVRAVNSDGDLIAVEVEVR